MGQHKYNPNCEKAKNGEFTSNFVRRNREATKRQLQRYLYGKIEDKLLEPFQSQLIKYDICRAGRIHDVEKELSKREKKE